MEKFLFLQLLIRWFPGQFQSWQWKFWSVLSTEFQFSIMSVESCFSLTKVHAKYPYHHQIYFNSFYSGSASYELMISSWVKSLKFQKLNKRKYYQVASFPSLFLITIYIYLDHKIPTSRNVKKPLNCIITKYTQIFQHFSTIFFISFYLGIPSSPTRYFAKLVRSILPSIWLKLILPMFSLN